MNELGSRAVFELEGEKLILKLAADAVAVFEGIANKGNRLLRARSPIRGGAGEQV